MRQVHLTAASGEALQSLARQQHITLGTLVYGAWALLLSRYSGAEDVVFGTSVDRPPGRIGRQRQDGRRVY